VPYNDPASIKGAHRSAEMLLAAVDRLTGRGPHDNDPSNASTTSRAVYPAQPDTPITCISEPGPGEPEEEQIEEEE
jgi:hypothetical protein